MSAYRRLGLVAILVAVQFLCAAAASSQDGRSGVKSGPCAGSDKPADDDGTLRKPPRVLELEARLRDAPDDPIAARELSQALLPIAEYMLYCSAASPKYKFPVARCLYKRVLELDPANDRAKDAIETIEAIYKSMERTVPEVDCE